MVLEFELFPGQAGEGARHRGFCLPASLRTPGSSASQARGPGLGSVGLLGSGSGSSLPLRTKTSQAHPGTARLFSRLQGVASSLGSHATCWGAGPEEEGQVSPPWARGQHRAALPAVERGVPESRAALGVVWAPGLGARPHAPQEPSGWPAPCTEGPRLHLGPGLEGGPGCTLQVGFRVAFFLLECGKDPISEAGVETHGSAAWASL